MRDFFIYSAEAVPLAGGATVAVRTNIDADADFEIYSQAATCLSNLIRVETFEASSGRTNQDVPVPLRGYYGDGRRPFHLPVTRRIKRGSTFISTVTDESAGANRVRLAYIGAKVFKSAPFPRPEYVAREPFTYTAPFVPAALDPAGVGAIAAAGVGIFNIRIQEDADFELRRITSVVDIAVPAASDSRGLVSLADETYNYRFMDRPIPLESLGVCQVTDVLWSAGDPFVLREPKLLRRASLFSVTVQNLDGANPMQLRMSFHGAKCYPQPGV